MTIVDLPPLRLLTVFETVVQLGGVRNAAAELNVTQPAISQSLRLLEEHVGAKLLDRSRRPSELTEAGRILRSATIEGLGRIGDAIGEIRLMQSAGEAAVTLACSVGFATYWLMPRLAGFYAAHPEIAVNVMTTHQGAPQLSPGIDIAVRYGGGHWTDGAVSKLFDERVAPVCAPALLAKMPAGGAIPEGAALLHVNAEESVWTTWPRYLREAGLPAFTGRGRQFTNYVQATQAALDGQGVMLGWRSITGDLVRDGRLCAAGAPVLTPKPAFYLVISAAGAGETGDAHLLAAWLAETAAGETSPA